MRTEADIKCTHTGKERDRRQTSVQQSAERRKYRRNEMHDGDNLTCM